MKASKVLGGLISVVSILGMVAFALGIQSMFSVIQTGIPGGSGEMILDPSAPIIIQLTPTNTGLLESSLDLSMEFWLDGEMVASDDLSIKIPAGSQVPAELELVIPEAVFLEATSDSTFQVVTVIRVASLFDYISFDNTMTIEGGTE